MGRAKLKLELIPKEKARNLTFKKRKEGIMKKIREFTTLCDVNACMIIYGPNSDSSEPAIWPEDRSEVDRMIDLYKKKGTDNTTRAYGLSNFFMEKKKKLEDDVKKLKQKNLEAKYPTCVDFLERLSKSELENFVTFLTGKIEASNSKLEVIGGIKDEDEQPQFFNTEELQQLQGCYGYNNEMMDLIQLENLGFVNPLQQVAYNPNVILDELSFANPTARIIPAAAVINEAEFMQFAAGASSSAAAENLPLGYRQHQQQVNYYEPIGMNGGGIMAAQCYMERTAMQLAVAPPPPYIGADLPPLPSCYLEVNEEKSACTLPALPQISGASYYLEGKESNGASTFPAIGGGGPPPQTAAYSYSEENHPGRSINYYHQLSRY